MKSRLLSRRELEALVDISNLQGLIAALSQTVYRKPIETALARTSGMDCIVEALHGDLTHTLWKARGFYQDRAGEMVTILYRFYDLQNLKAIFRGVGRQVPPAEVEPALLPVGELTGALLADLVRAPGSRYVIDLLASVGLPFAHPLFQLRAEHPGAGTLEMELALDKWYFQESFQTLQHNGQNEVLLAALQLEADMINLLTVLRFAFAPEEHKHLRDRFNTENIADLFVGPGNIPTQVLNQAGHQDSVEAAVATLAETPYAHSLRAGLETYSQTAMLSAFERQLKRFRLNWMSGAMVKDPLGIGVPTGYLALKINEVNNVRWIAQGIHMGLKTDIIRAELEVLT